MKKLCIALIVLYAGSAMATLADVFHSAGQTFQEGVRTVGETIGVSASPYSAGSLRFHNTSPDTVYITVNSDSLAYRENGIERFEVRPGESILLSPDLTRTVEIQVERGPSNKQMRRIPQTKKAEVMWDGKEFQIRPL